MKFFKPEDFAKPYAVVVPTGMTQPEVMAAIANTKLDAESPDTFLSLDLGEFDLVQENARLRGALEWILNLSTVTNAANRMKKKARAALECQS